MHEIKSLVCMKSTRTMVGYHYLEYIPLSIPSPFLSVYTFFKKKNN